MFYHTNHLGSITRMTDLLGRTAKTYQYDAYGAILAEQGPSLVDEFAYTARSLHDRSGLYYYRARFYSPELGRFITQDPIGMLGGPNLYAYVGNDPIEFTDPIGLLYLEFDAGENLLLVYPGTEETQGPPQAFPARNKVRSGCKKWPKGKYEWDWHSPHKNERDKNGAYGLYGNFIFEVEGHEGMGVHSGRANKGGPEYETLGCIRTTDEAMKVIYEHHYGGDPLMHIVVR